MLPFKFIPCVSMLLAPGNLPKSMTVPVVAFGVVGCHRKAVPVEAFPPDTWPISLIAPPSDAVFKSGIIDPLVPLGVVGDQRTAREGPPVLTAFPVPTIWPFELIPNPWLLSGNPAMSPRPTAEPVVPLGTVGDHKKICVKPPPSPVPTIWPDALIPFTAFITPDTVGAGKLVHVPDVPFGIVGVHSRLGEAALTGRHMILQPTTCP
jgi:hypothetical protein